MILFENIIVIYYGLIDIIIFYMNYLMGLRSTPKITIAHMQSSYCLKGNWYMKFQVDIL